MVTAIIAGATGLIGRQVIAELKCRNVAVTAVVRRAGATGVDELVVDFDALGSLPRADAAFCALGTTIRKAGSQEAFRRVDYTYVVSFAAACFKAGTPAFVVVSSVGASKTGNFYLRTKAEMEEAVSAFPFKALHIFRPSLLLGHRQESRPAESVAIAVGKLMAPLFVGPLQKYRPVDARTVAAAMVASAEVPGRYVHHYDDIIKLASGPASVTRETS